MEIWFYQPHNDFLARSVCNEDEAQILAARFKHVIYFFWEL